MGKIYLKRVNVGDLCETNDGQKCYFWREHGLNECLGIKKIDCSKGHVFIKVPVLKRVEEIEPCISKEGRCYFKNCEKQLKFTNKKKSCLDLCTTETCFIEVPQ